ncbi:hypothetical protein [Lentzea sp. NPDC003310]|uniref:hypothetical protein n=1 Tax=Lentzea sp. NPDC003310 TaxID=3154447 RepID=UPI0033B67051
MSAPTNPLTTTTLTLYDVCRSIATTCPPLGAPPEQIARWFEYCVRLLAPITRDRSHPEHHEAVEMAAKYSHDALATREAARVNGAAR